MKSRMLWRPIQSQIFAVPLMEVVGTSTLHHNAADKSITGHAFGLRPGCDNCAPRRRVCLAPMQKLRHFDSNEDRVEINESGADIYREAVGLPLLGGTAWLGGSE
ncbi:hypothetical protein RAS2_22130 [Phycisphaerae bacterium RAS2]|nr:hypothetical protein RAS2_22130 [Phycisphaerae bacterium RAS2]